MLISCTCEVTATVLTLKHGFSESLSVARNTIEGVEPSVSCTLHCRLSTSAAYRVLRNNDNTLQRVAALRVVI